MKLLLLVRRIIKWKPNQSLWLSNNHKVEGER
jgi:hypothetical protein